jgi:hypothetical protein
VREHLGGRQLQKLIQMRYHVTGVRWLATGRPSRRPILGGEPAEQRNFDCSFHAKAQVHAGGHRKLPIRRLLTERWRAAASVANWIDVRRQPLSGLV